MTQTGNGGDTPRSASCTTTKLPQQNCCQNHYVQEALPPEKSRQALIYLSETLCKDTPASFRLDKSECVSWWP